MPMPQDNSGFTQGSNPGGYQPFPWWLFNQIYGSGIPQNFGTGGIPTQGLAPTAFPGATPNTYTPPTGFTPGYDPGLNFSGGQFASESPTFQAPPDMPLGGSNAYGYQPMPWDIFQQVYGGSPPYQGAQLPPGQQAAAGQAPPDYTQGSYLPGVGYYPQSPPYAGGNVFAGGGGTPQWLQDLSGAIFNTAVPTTPFLGGLAGPNWGAQVGQTGGGGNVGAPGDYMTKAQAQSSAYSDAYANLPNYYTGAWQGPYRGGGVGYGTGPRQL